MIRTLTLKSGPTHKEHTVELPRAPITIFVGPNNSGKSRALKNIFSACANHPPRGYNPSIDVVFDTFSDGDAEKIVRNLDLLDVDERTTTGDAIALLDGKATKFLNRKTAKRLIASGKVHEDPMLMVNCIRYLNGMSRLQITSDCESQNLKHVAMSSIVRLIHNNKLREEVRNHIYDAFGLYFVIDTTGMKNIQIRLSQSLPKSDDEELGMSMNARRFHANATAIEDFGDGTRAYTGIVMQLVAGSPQIVLIDEPESFLHPPLASRMGSLLSTLALNHNRQVFAATHSPAFVMGCINSGVNVNIVRLTYRSKVGTAHLIPQDELRAMLRNPLIRSTNFLSGLFYDNVVLTESDSDRAFYQEINERLLRYQSQDGIPDCLFLNAQNKQTQHTIFGALRKYGIAAAGIMDIDMIKEGGKTWSNMANAAKIPPALADSWGRLRSSILAAFKATGKEMKTDGGVTLLSEEYQVAAKQLFSDLAKYGVFVIEGGEVESWLKELGPIRHGTQWISDMFEKLGQDLNADQYVKPTDGDVWAFLSQVRNWLVDPNRDGM